MTAIIDKIINKYDTLLIKLLKIKYLKEKQALYQQDNRNAQSYLI